MSKSLVLSFEEHDSFSRQEFCLRLEKFILVENDFVEGSLVVSIDAGFGSGKTTFLEMWKDSLLTRRNKGQFEPMPVILNAWESDHCGDPLSSILAGLLQAIDDWKGNDRPDKSGLANAAKDVAWFFLGLANEFTAKAGVNPLKAAEHSAAKKTARSKIPDFISLYRERVQSLAKLKDELVATFGGQTQKVIIFVDELDRCRPDYAISYLETIKHVFDLDGIVFVLAVDLSQLESSAKALFGEGLDFDNYYRKFSHRTIQLPLPSRRDFEGLSKKYFARYLEIAGKRMSVLSAGRVLDHIPPLAKALEMRPRQIQEGFRIMGHAAATLSDDARGNLYWGLGAGLALMSFLKVSHPSVFQRFTRGGASKEVVGLLASGLDKREAQWWVELVVSGISGADAPLRPLVDVMFDIATVFPNLNSVEAITANFGDAWGSNRRRLFRIGSMIENIESFFQST